MRKFNAVVLGAGGVGKSALTIRFMRQVFVDSYDPTIEEAYRKTVVVDGENYFLEVLDTAGAEQFTALNEYYIKGGNGFVLVFSLTQATSMREIESLRQQIYRIKGVPLPPAIDPAQPPASSHGHASKTRSVLPSQDSLGLAHTASPATSVSDSIGMNVIPIVLVGTKSDLSAEREVSRETAVRLASAWGVPYYETSSKKNLNVTAVFMDIVRQMKVHSPEGAGDTIEEQPGPKKKKSHKCIIQ